MQLIDGTSYIFIPKGRLTFVGITKANSNAMLLLCYLRSLISCIVKQVGCKDLDDEETIRKNLCCIYEVLDETMDYGLPQLADPPLLSHCLMLSKLKRRRTEVKEVTQQVTGSCSWRPVGIFYRNNEIYVDIIENVNVQVSSSGQILSSFAEGIVQMRTRLSGFPECHMGLNDAIAALKPSKKFAADVLSPPRRNMVALDDLQFHQCVRLNTFDKDHSINFIPPDGTFTLLRYRATRGVKLPIRLSAQVVEKSRTRVQISLRVQSLIGTHFPVNELEFRIPCPPNTVKMWVIGIESGKAKLVLEDGVVVWKIKRLPSAKEGSLMFETESVSSVEDDGRWARPPILCDFTIPMTTASGLTVRHLRIMEKGNYRTSKWIRYVTRAGRYEIRI